MSEMERKEVLDMLAAGKITAAEAAELLSSLSKGAQPAAEALKEKSPERGSVEDEVFVLDETAAWKPVEKPYPSDIVTSNGDKPRWLRIRVRDMATGRNKVTVNLPLRLVSFGLGVANRFGADMNGVEVGEILEAIKQGEKGILVDVEDEEDGEHVQIYLE